MKKLLRTISVIYPRLHARKYAIATYPSLMYTWPERATTRITGELVKNLFVIKSMNLNIELYICNVFVGTYKRNFGNIFFRRYFKK